MELRDETPGVRGWLHVIRRQWLLVAACTVLVPAVAVGFSLQQQPEYESTAQVLLSRQNLATSLTGGTDPTASNIGFERVVETQAELARTPEVARRAARSVGLRQQPDAFLARATAVASPDSDLITFTVRDENPRQAARIVNAYARAYTSYREQLDTAGVRRALDEVERRLTRLRGAEVAPQDERLYNSLIDKEQQLRTLEVLQTSNAYVARAASQAVKVRPEPVRNGIIGLLLGVALGLGLAFLRSALDTRVRSGDELAARLGMPLLARIPAVKGKSDPVLAVVEHPESAMAESVRMLRTQLEFASLDTPLKTLLVTSAVQGEGKSTTAANLAIALAQAGERVALLDLDLRRPTVHRLFGLDSSPGITEGVIGTVDRDAAGHEVLAEQLGGSERGGHLDVFPTGILPPRPGDFVGRKGLAAFLESLRDEYDRVVIDTTPAVSVGDAISLSRLADGVLVVARLKLLNRNLVAELARLLAAAPTPSVGFVITGAEDEGYRYAYGRYAQIEQPSTALTPAS